MFIIDVILGALKKLISFLREYKFIILTAAIITVLYLRGNNYKQEWGNMIIESNKNTSKGDKDE